MKAKYALEGASQIVVDMEAIEAMGVCPLLGDYLEEGEVARHATDRVAHDLMALMAQAPERQSIRKWGQALVAWRGSTCGRAERPLYIRRFAVY